MVECEDDADAILRALDALSPTRVGCVTISSKNRWKPAHHWVHPVDLDYPATFYAPQLQRLDPFPIAIREGQSGVLKLWEIAPPGFL